MNSLNGFVILVIAFVLVFLESTFNTFRFLFGVQVDLLPSLVVYTSLRHGLFLLTTVAVLAGLWFDSMSSNPLGISVVPLFMVGFLVQRYRGFVLRDQPFAQIILGLAASAAVPVLTLLFLLSGEKRPLLGWVSVWQWVIMSLIGGAVTPFWFRFFDRISQAVNYRPLGETSFREDREIKRGRF